VGRRAALSILVMVANSTARVALTSSVADLSRDGSRPPSRRADLVVELRRRAPLAALVGPLLSTLDQ
jgi:hypothetical protein